MNKFEERDAVLKCLSSNKGGVTVEQVMEYLDYVNKLAYSDKEVTAWLRLLEVENKVIQKNNLWYPL